MMIYREAPKTGDRLSILGMGCMRFPRRAGGAAIDEEAAGRLILEAADRGINLFDTAYIYPGSEKVLGKTLSQAGLRDSVIIQTKAPSMIIKDIDDAQNIFETQLSRLKTDYVDHYLLHHLDSFADYERLRDMGVERFFERERARGRARRFGFSFHGNVREFKRIADAYPWDVCVIQYNYLDERYQAGAEGLAYAADKGLAVIAMEPLRGGLLGDRMPEGALKLLRGVSAPANRPESRPANPPENQPANQPTPTPTPAPAPVDAAQAASLAFRWVWSQPGVTSALSGMSEARHLDGNCLAVDSADTGGVFALSDLELRKIDEVRAFFAARSRVPCTACAYCLPCPAGVDIPTCFALFNTYATTGSVMSKFRYVLSTEGAVNGHSSKASLCAACGACERKCPQHIAIRDQLKNVAKEMEKPWIRIPGALALRAAAGFRAGFGRRSNE